MERVQDDYRTAQERGIIRWQRVGTCHPGESVSQNPYAAPSAPVSDMTSRADDARIQDVAKGQKMMVWAVLGGFFLSLLRPTLGDVVLVLVLVAAVFGIIGAVRLAKGLGSGILMRIFIAILMLVPLVSLVTMLVLSMRATRALRAAGWSVGLMGARPR